MHGDESTTTKGLLDLINTLLTDSPDPRMILDACSIEIIPILNPDGALQYTRENARGIDLNRDAQDLKQPESRVLRKLYDSFKPHYCLNLHDQRSIYSAGPDRNSATLSFLAPAADKQISITPSREKSMLLVAAMCEALKPMLGNGIGRYDDSYNLNCVGDTFQSQGTPTVLFEAGHFPEDYQRETTRKFIWHSLMTALLVLSSNRLEEYRITQYTDIPNNEKRYFDILIRHAHNLNKKYRQGDSIGILYNEQLNKDRIEFHPAIETVDKLDDHYGHLEYDCSNSSDLEKLQNSAELKSLLF